MKQYNSNLAYIDMLFNLLIGFVSLFILAFMLINPVAETGKIDPVTQFMITLEWEDESINDLDLWVLGPTEDRPVGYVRKENGFMVLDRDDLGRKNDTFMVDGVEHSVKKNLETVMINDVIEGEYIVNVHYFGPTHSITPEVATVVIYDMHPYRLVFSRKIDITIREELTAVTFYITADGEIIEPSIHINRKIRETIKPHYQPSDVD